MTIFQRALKFGLGGPRVLADLREDSGIRGFHLAACLSLLIDAKAEVEFWVVGGSDGDVQIELELLRHRSGQEILRWNPAAPDLRFALYVAMADTTPEDAISRKARQCSKRMLLGLMFPPDTLRRAKGVIRVHGHDTAEFAGKIASELGLEPSFEGVAKRA